jgi:hypothetical protein
VVLPALHPVIEAMEILNRVLLVTQDLQTASHENV